MENKFQCPPSFDVNAARVYVISPQFKDEFAGKPYISVMALNGKQRPVYLSALGKIWKQILLPEEVVFEEVVHDCDKGGNFLKHFHTEFNLGGRAVHIDYVHAWSYGPGAGQTHVMIYVDGNLGASAALGGGSFGQNWSRRWPATLTVEGFLLRFTQHMNFPPKDKIVFKPGDEDAPVVLYQSVSPQTLPFRVFDLTSAAFVEQKLIPSMRFDQVDHVFYKAASDDDKRKFFAELLRRGRGHFVSDEALSEMVSHEIFSNCLGFPRKKCVFKEKGGSIEGTDFELNEYRTEELTNYFRELLPEVR